MAVNQSPLSTLVGFEILPHCLKGRDFLIELGHFAFPIDTTGNTTD